MFVKAKGIKGINGDYVAFHEIYVSDDYIFGDYRYIGDNAYDVLLESLKLDWDSDDPLEKQDKKILDEIMYKWLDNFDREYDPTDYALCDCVLELDDNGEVLKVYWS